MKKKKKKKKLAAVRPFDRTKEGGGEGEEGAEEAGQHADTWMSCQDSRIKTAAK